MTDTDLLLDADIRELSRLAYCKGIQSLFKIVNSFIPCAVEVL